MTHMVWKHALQVASVVPLAIMMIATPGIQAASLPDRVDFNYHIKPLLSDRCYACHGPDEKGRKAKLRLDTKEGAFGRTKDDSFVIKPRQPSQSEVIRRITSTDPDEKMPPPKSNLSLSADDIALIRRWVEQGAEWKRHWAFIGPEKSRFPSVRDKKWPRNELDRFVLAKLERDGLRPMAESDREHLIRRASFDLTGLPPAPVEVDAFVQDKSANAYEKLIDRLLASPAYGERMAMEWMDVARYADTYGYQADRFNHLWPWRDWVISAFNRNLPFNDFIIWQLAGDLLPKATREQRLATAFNRNHRQTNEGGSVDEEFRVEYNADRVHTAAGAFLGLTMECARCHDHRYDPITQKDYYRMFAFFNSTDESGLYSHFTDAIPSPTVLLYKDDAQENKRRDLLRQIVAKEKETAVRRELVANEFASWLKAGPQLTNGLGLIGRYTFDSITNQTVQNTLGTNFLGKMVESPKSVEGKAGSALLFSGENSVTIDKVADFKRTDAFSFSLWLKIPEEKDEIVVLHHQQAGSDAGYQGYQLVLEHGHATFALIHFWPGNALRVRSRDKLKLNEWLQLGIAYDGSSHATGVKLYSNGQPIAVEIDRDSLFKDSANGAPLTLGARFRGRGFKDGLIDDLQVFNRCLTPLEVQRVYQNAPVTVVAKTDPNALLEYYLVHVDQSSAVLRTDLKKLRDEENKLINSVDEIMAMGDLPKPRPTYLLKRGAYDQHGDQVEPGTPEAIFPFDPKLPRNRLGFAKWITDPKHPLTARVIVNRYWQLHFGRGLVTTTENFGSQGTLPTHPELLDWLARTFVESGWDLKKLHKLILLSATYRQSSQASPELLARDPDNKLLARGPSHRLPAELIRDNALAAAGLLVNKIGGPSVKPYQPDGLWEEKSAGWKYEPDKGEGLYRRSFYTYWKRTSPPPSMMTFDATERNNCTVRRQVTSTPLQSLVLLNDPQFVEAARFVGQRALQEGGTSIEDQIRLAFRLILTRQPTARELPILQRLFAEQLEFYRAHPDDAEKLSNVGSTPANPNVDHAQLAAATAVASAILNLDEAITKR